VAAETRLRVLETIRRLNYKPNIVARNLRRQRTSALALIIPDNLNPFYAEVSRGVEKVAIENGYTVMLCHSDYQPERESQYVDVLHAERVAGVIWFPATANQEVASQLAEYGMPCVLLDGRLPGCACPSVRADSWKGGYLAACHLLELGHRKMGYITRPFESHQTQDRIRGLGAAFREYGLSEDQVLIHRGGFRLEDGKEAAEHLLEMEPGLTAILGYNDVMAIGAMRATYERGLRVPDDVSIIGFNDIPQAAYVCPSLTTIRQPKFEMGVRGVKLLLDLIEGKAVPAEADTILEVELIVRESTAACRECEKI
jgi:DNA-binding LacI/PurR family transcriptional regulator